MKKIIVVSWSVFVLVVISSLLEAGVERWCLLCGMNLKMYHQTNNRLTFFDSGRVQTCSLFCAAQIYEKRADEIDRWEIVDYETKSFIDAKKAHYLIGSDIPGVMTAVSKIAFSSLEDTRKYQQKHGGTIGPFDEALNRTLSDMASDRKMIMARVAEREKMGKDLAEKHRCFQCHGEEGKGGSASAWNTLEFSRKIDTRIKMKEAITRRCPAMSGDEGKIDEKDLHSITLYIWSLRQLSD